MYIPHYRQNPLISFLSLCFELLPGVEFVDYYKNQLVIIQKMKIRDIHSLQLVSLFIEQEHFFLSPYLAGKASLKTTEREEKKVEYLFITETQRWLYFSFRISLFQNCRSWSVAPPYPPLKFESLAIARMAFFVHLYSDLHRFTQK